MGEIGRASEQIRQGFGDCVDHQLRCLPRGDRWPLSVESLAELMHRRTVFERQFFGSAHRETASAARR